MGLVKKILILANVGLVVALLLAYLSPTTNPNDNGMYALFGIFYPALLLANLGLMVLWIFVDYRYLFLSLVAILFGWNHLTGFVNVSATTAKQADLRLMSYNLGSGYYIRDRDKATQQAKTQDFVDYLATIDAPDIICVQEFNSYLKAIFVKQFEGYEVHHIANKGAIIFSKYPIVNGGNIEFGTRTNSCVYADIVKGSDTLRVYNMHLQSNSISREADDVIENADLKAPKTWKSIKGILGKYAQASKVRATQARRIREHSTSSPYPVVLCGDANDPPTSYTYGTLAAGLTDAFHAKGSGIGTTYGGSIPMLRIDYILADPTMAVTAYQCRKEIFSDHYPIFAEVKL